MDISIQMLLCVGCVIAYRIMLDKFCKQVDYIKKLIYVAGMILAYTAVIIQMIYIVGELVMLQISVADFRAYVCVLIFAVNIVFGFITIVYCSTARKRTLSNREKIMLKDL